MSTKKTTKATTQKPDRTIRAGDVVVLRSDGPKMVVERIGTNGDNRVVAFCAWFDPRFGVYTSSDVNVTCHAHQEEFALAALLRV